MKGYIKSAIKVEYILYLENHIIQTKDGFQLGVGLENFHMIRMGINKLYYLKMEMLNVTNYTE